MKFIKIYGLQRTGTNYMEWICKNNFKDVHVLSESNATGWKHGSPISVKDIDWTGLNWDDPVKIKKGECKENIAQYLEETLPLKKKIEEADELNDFKYIFVFRDPWSWFASRGPEWALNKDYHSEFGEDIMWSVQELADAVILWNIRCMEYIKFHYEYPDKCFLVAHYDLINFCESSVFNKIKDHFHLESFSDKLIDQEKEVGARLEIHDNEFSREKYRDRLFWTDNRLMKPPLTSVTAKLISEVVDPAVLNLLGFPYIDMNPAFNFEQLAKEEGIQRND